MTKTIVFERDGETYCIGYYPMDNDTVGELLLEGNAQDATPEELRLAGYVHEDERHKLLVLDDETMRAVARENELLRAVLGRMRHKLLLSDSYWMGLVDGVLGLHLTERIEGPR